MKRCSQWMCCSRSPLTNGTCASGQPGQPVQAKGLQAGKYSVCATVYPPQVEGMGGVMDYMKREGDNLPVQCQSVVISEAAEQNMTMRVTVPEFVPDPSGGEGAGEDGPS